MFYGVEGRSNKMYVKRNDLTFRLPEKKFKTVKPR